MRNYLLKPGNIFSKLFVSLLLLLTCSEIKSQNISVPVGSFIINMGIVPQTVGNALKPYGMIYDLIRNYGVPIHWVVNPAKAKDGVDFTYAGVDYKGGPFIIPANFRTSEVNARITYWQSQGVVGISTTSPLEVPVLRTLSVSAVPSWTLDEQNGSIVLGYFTNAGIPPAAYGGNDSQYWKTPAELDCCDDIFVMPHADPKWLTHSRLYSWNLECKGNIWLACHAGSALENMYNPADTSQQANFLSCKVNIPGTGIILPVAGSTAYAQNSLILWGNHSGGTLPYSYSNHGDPIMQFMGKIDAATLNGSEQIYIPVQADGCGWRSTTVTGVYDPDHISVTRTEAKYRAAVLAYGRGFGNENRGFVMMEAAHSHNKALLTDNIAAQRAFFNFSFWAAREKAPDPGINLNVSSIYSGESAPLSFDIGPKRNISEFTILWTSSCGGSFSPANTQATTFVAPIVSQSTNCVITLTLTDNCGRVYKSSSSVMIACDLQVTTTLTNPCYGDPTGGAIAMSITNGNGPFRYSWSRTEGGSGTGTGTTLSGLNSGNYSITVTANDGAGCSLPFTIALASSPEIVMTAAPVNVGCNGGSNGAVNVSVSGGVPPYSFTWNDGTLTQNRSNLTAGTYTVTVTDAKGCTKVATATVAQPNAIVITPAVGNINCYGDNSGTISLTVAGGTGPFTFLWNDGSSSQNRTGLATGTYAVTVTDANNCEQSASGLTVTQPSAALSLGQSHVDILCYGNNTGSIDLTVTGGTGPYTYAWTAGGGGIIPSGQEDDPDLSNLTAGNYSVTVTDDKGCTSTLSVTLTQPPLMVLSITKVDATCPPGADQNASTGTIDLDVSGGVGPYQYYWTTGDGIIPAGQEDDQDLSTLVAGTYNVQVTDANNCIKTTSSTITNLNPNPVQPVGITH